MSFSSSRRHRHRRMLILARQHAARAEQLDCSGLAYLHSSIDLDQPLNWVFTGERLPVQRGESTLGEETSRVLRDRFGRVDDMIFDSTQRCDSVSGLEAELDQRVLKYDPGVVVVTVGRAHGEIAQRLLDSQALAHILSTLDKQHMVSVVVPTPVVLFDDDIELQCRWYDDVVDIAAACGALLVPTESCAHVTAVGRSLLVALGLDQPLLKVTEPDQPRSREILSISG